jgi:hypothetical protein
MKKVIIHIEKLVEKIDLQKDGSLINFNPEIKSTEEVIVNIEAICKSFINALNNPQHEKNNSNPANSSRS